jgi:hypothetical protein
MGIPFAKLGYGRGKAEPNEKVAFLNAKKDCKFP